MCENDEPMSLSSSEASSDTDTDPEEQELAMDLGEPALASEHSTSSKLSTQGHWQAGHRQRRCHTSLDLTRSQKVCGTAGQTLWESFCAGHGMDGAEFSWGDACTPPCPAEIQGVRGQWGIWAVFWNINIHVCLQVREILLQASQQGPKAELPTAPQPGEQPLCAPPPDSEAPHLGKVTPSQQQGWTACNGGTSFTQGRSCHWTVRHCRGWSSC